MASIADKRREDILKELKREGTANVSELSKQFGVSEVSIRRDLTRLEQQGLLRRTHGGAVAIPDEHPAQPHAEKIRQHCEEKERIGRTAAGMIQPGERIIFDSGTTVAQVAHHIPTDLLETGPLIAITAAIPIVHELGHHKGVQLILLGGIYLPEHQTTAGPQTISNLKGLHADKLFLGTDGLTLSHGLTTANVFEAEVDKMMVESATEIIAVADSSKIGVVGLATIVPLRRIDKLITDTNAPANFVAGLREQGVEVILV